MTTKAKSYRLPWTLPEEVCYYLEISEGVFTCMMRGSEPERKAGALIAEHWTKRSDKAGRDLPFGLYIPRRYGLTGSERAALADSGQAERERGLRSLRLIEQIAIDTGLTPDDVKRQLNSVQDSDSIDYPAISPYLSQFLEIISETEPAEESDKVVTIYMRRIIPQWSDALTASLHSRIMEDLQAFAYMENVDESGGEEKKEETP